MYDLPNFQFSLIRKAVKAFTAEGVHNILNIIVSRSSLTKRMSTIKNTGNRLFRNSLIHINLNVALQNLRHGNVQIQVSGRLLKMISDRHRRCPWTKIPLKIPD
jgi:hypothetical protein